MGIMSNVVNYYDFIFSNPSQQDFYQNTGYGNFGYWEQSTDSTKKACDNLVDKLLSLIPEKEGTVLDVACGAGGTTNRLLKYYKASDITAINISEKQLELASENAKGCNFIVMDAVTLEFDDASFDNIICVESAYHFDTRINFLREAYRVLKPGGHLVMSDLIVPPFLVNMLHKPLFHPIENKVADEEEYKDSFYLVGFKNVNVIDATENAWKSFRKHMLSSQWRSEERSMKTMLSVGGSYIVSSFMDLTIRKYLLFSAQKNSSVSG